MKTRPAREDDIEELKTLLIETIRNTCTTDYTEEQLDAWAYSAQKKSHWNKFINDQFTLVCEINNTIVGFGSLEHGNHIYFMYVHQDYLKQGIASEIYTQLEQESLWIGNAQMTADVSKTALAFFQRKGFNTVKENINTINGITIINYRMIKSLKHPSQQYSE